MSDIGLTPAQADVLFYIKQCLEESTIAPSFDEIKDYLGLKSKSGVHRIVHALIERGHIHMMKDRKRSIALGPEEVRAYFCPHCRELVNPKFYAVQR